MTTIRSALVGIALSSIATTTEAAAQQTACPQLATEVARFCSALQTDAERYVLRKGVQFAYQRDPVQTLIDDAYRSGAIERPNDLRRADLVRINAFIKEREAQSKLPRVTYI